MAYPSIARIFRVFSSIRFSSPSARPGNGPPLGLDRAAEGAAFGPPSPVRRTDWPSVRLAGRMANPSYGKTGPGNGPHRHDPRDRYAGEKCSCSAGLRRRQRPGPQSFGPKQWKAGKERLEYGDPGRLANVGPGRPSHLIDFRRHEGRKVFGFTWSRNFPGVVPGETPLGCGELQGAIPCCECLSVRLSRWSCAPVWG